MTKAEREERRKQELVTSVVEALIAGGCEEEAEALAQTKSTQEFDALCKHYCETNSEAGLNIQMIMFLFYDWHDDGNMARLVAEFTEKWGHPISYCSVAKFYWLHFGDVRKQWKLVYPELSERFDNHDIYRIPWRVKYGYAAQEMMNGWVPVPDYGTSLEMRRYKLKTKGKVYEFTAEEGQPYEEARAKAVGVEDQDVKQLLL